MSRLGFPPHLWKEQGTAQRTLATQEPRVLLTLVLICILPFGPLPNFKQKEKKKKKQGRESDETDGPGSIFSVVQGEMCVLRHQSGQPRVMGLIFRSTSVVFSGYIIKFSALTFI